MSKFYIGGLVDAYHLGPALEALDRFKISNLDIKLVPDEPRESKSPKESKRKLLPPPHSHKGEPYITIANVLIPQIEELAETSSVVTSQQIVQMCAKAGRLESSAWYGMGELVKKGVLRRIEKGVYQIISAIKDTQS